MNIAEAINNFREALILAEKRGFALHNVRTTNRKPWEAIESIAVLQEVQDDQLILSYKNKYCAIYEVIAITITELEMTDEQFEDYLKTQKQL
jgi:hypothetical protein